MDWRARCTRARRYVWGTMHATIGAPSLRQVVLLLVWILVPVSDAGVGFKANGRCGYEDEDRAGGVDKDDGGGP